MKTTWKLKHEFYDGTGFEYFECQCPQGVGRWPDILYQLHYAPTENKVWFYNALDDNAVTVRMMCTSWADAERVKAILTTMKSYWMKEHTGEST